MSPYFDFLKKTPGTAGAPVINILRAMIPTIPRGYMYYRTMQHHR